jgi:ZIP family zinc transporter
MPGGLLSGLLLSLVAGLATTIGSAVAFVVPRFSGAWLSAMLGFAAGAMISVSFVELFAGATQGIGLLMASVGFFAGYFAIFLVDVLIPHEYQAEVETDDRTTALRRAGLLTALGIAIHNLPEGLVVLSGAAESARLGILLAVAIAVHNVPEGIAVSVPILAATGSRTRAFLYSFLSGLAEPVGALLGALILMPFMSETVISFTLALVAGIMVFISFDELLPTAHRYGHEHAAGIGVAAGMLVMIATLIALQ